MPRRTLVWVEDDIDVVDPVIKPLRQPEADFRIVECRTYSEALAALDEIRNCDIVLLDLILPPGKSDAKDDYLGLTLLRRLRQEFEIHVPVIIFSVIAEAKDVVDRQELRALNAHILEKPVRPSELKKEVWEVLGLAP